MPSAKQDLLMGWHHGLRVLIRGSYDAAKHYTRSSDFLGIAVIATSAITGSAVFANLGSLPPASKLGASPAAGFPPHFFLQVGAGVFSVIATVLASVQKFLALPERAAKHEEAARKYDVLRREVQVLVVRLKDGVTVNDEAVDSIRARWDQIDRDAPSIPAAIYDKAEANVLRSEHQCRTASAGA